MTGSSRRLAAPEERTAPRADESPIPGAARARSHAKVIVLGEHAVVHGGPAISMPVHALSLTASAIRTRGPLGIDCVLYRGPISAAPDRLAAPATAIRDTLRWLHLPESGVMVRIDGDIPAERGLGSSAAAAAAISAAVARSRGIELAGDDHFELVQAAERVAHGTPSGLDARSVVASAPLWFQAGSVHRLPVRLNGVFVIADTGITGGTRQAVADVAALKTRDPRRVSRVLDQIDEHTTAGADDLAHDRVAELGERMSAVHALLRELTVSSTELDALVEVAGGAGALGAKLTGGGRGGCILALADSTEQAHRIAAALTAAGAVHTWLLRPEDLSA